MKNKFKIRGKIVWIFLTQGKKTQIDLRDFEIASHYRWRAQRRRENWYVMARLSGDRATQLHREILGNPKSQVDHRNLDGLDNRRSNLRVATQNQNQRNKGRQKNNKSGFKGVGKHYAQWRARIVVNGVSQYLGHFYSPVEAAQAYDKAARKFHGEFARTNF